MADPISAADMNHLLMRPLVMPSGFFPHGRPLVTSGGYRLTADDRLDMQALVHRFDWTLLSEEFDELAALFTDDVVIDHGFGLGQGKEEGMRVIRAVPSTGLRHHMTNHVVFIDADGEPALACYMLVFQLAAEPAVGVALPHVLDQNVLVVHFQREDGAWRIRRMVFDQARLSAHIGAPDQVHVDMGLRASERAERRQA